MNLKLFLKLLIFFAPILASLGQEKPQGKFLKNNIKVGEPVEYSLSIRYPSNKQILFPDSTYNYFPFEFIEKRYFKTISDNATSLDSVIYKLATFEIDSVQRLALPVFFMQEEDTTKVFADDAIISLVPTITVVSDSVKLMENANYAEVDQQINVTYWTFGILLISLVLLLLILIFGKPILRKIKTIRLIKLHEKFLKDFQDLKRSIRQDNFEKQLLNIYILWKKYLQQLTNRPFTSYSTKDIEKIIIDKELIESLKVLDRGIYAGKYSGNIEPELDILLKYSEKFYKQKIEEVRRGATK